MAGWCWKGEGIDRMCLSGTCCDETCTNMAQIKEPAHGTKKEGDNVEAIK
jgi:hypothetical protein